MNYRIILCIALVILSVGIIFSFSMTFFIDFYDPDWNGIVNSYNSEDTIKEKIFLIGSSNLYSINAKKINEQLDAEEKNYLVYNLADMADTPTKRSVTIDNIISHKPKLVLYGIGMWEFEKFKSQSNSISDYILNPQSIFEVLFEQVTDSSIREQLPGSPKDRSLTTIKYIIRGPDQPYHPFIKFVPSPINDYEKIIDTYGIPSSNGLDLTDKNKKIIALKQNIQKLHNSGIKVVLFSNPQHSIAFYEITDDELETFKKVLNENAQKLNTTPYFLHDRYSELDIWRDTFHIAIHPNSDMYTNDIQKIIFQELDDNVI